MQKHLWEKGASDNYYGEMLSRIREALKYARELCGEYGRWALLKRHKAFESRLAIGNPRAAKSFTQKHYLRPISYDFLSQIDNADEYGTNGY